MLTPFSNWVCIAVIIMTTISTESKSLVFPSLSFHGSVGPHVYHVDSDGNVKDSPILKHLGGHWIIETVKYILHK